EVRTRARPRATSDGWHFHDCRHHFASWFTMRGGNLLTLSRIAGLLASSSGVSAVQDSQAREGIHDRESTRASRKQFLEPRGRERDDDDVAQVMDSTTTRRDSSVAEQLIRNPARRRRTRTQSNASPHETEQHP